MDNSEVKVIHEVVWLGPLTLVVVHAAGLGLLYLLLTVFGPTFVEHYELQKIATTPPFNNIHRYADFLIRYPQLLLGVILLDACIVRWLAKQSSRWLSPYSHCCLVAIGLLMFISISWMINPMALANGTARTGNAARALPVSTSNP